MALNAPLRLEQVYSMSIQLALRFDEAPITCETRAALSFHPGEFSITLI